MPVTTTFEIFFKAVDYFAHSPSHCNAPPTSEKSEHCLLTSEVPINVECLDSVMPRQSGMKPLIEKLTLDHIICDSVAKTVKRTHRNQSFTSPLCNNLSTCVSLM